MAGAWVLSAVVSVGLIVIGFLVANRIVWWCVAAAIVLLWLYQLAVLLRRRLGVHYRLTSQRFFHEAGILIHTTDLIEVIDMDDITYRQTLIDRMTGVGTIRIVSSDRSHPDLSIDGIRERPPRRRPAARRPARRTDPPRTAHRADLSHDA